LRARHTTYFADYRGRRCLIALGIAIALLAPSTAFAKSRPPRPGDISAPDAYRESVPTSRGSQPAGSGPTRGAPLPPGVVSRLKNDATGKLLREVATSPALGAPTKIGKARSGPELKPWTIGSGISAVGSGIGGTNWRLAALLVALAVVTVVSSAAAIVRHRLAAHS
jgi:hypothetical protein